MLSASGCRRQNLLLRILAETLVSLNIIFYSFRASELPDGSGSHREPVRDVNGSQREAFRDVNVSRRKPGSRRDGSRREPGRGVNGSRRKPGSRRERVANSPLAKEAGCGVGRGGHLRPYSRRRRRPRPRCVLAPPWTRLGRPFPAASPISSTQTPETMRGARHSHYHA